MLYIPRNFSPQWIFYGNSNSAPTISLLDALLLVMPICHKYFFWVSWQVLARTLILWTSGNYWTKSSAHSLHPRSNLKTNSGLVMYWYQFVVGVENKNTKNTRMMPFPATCTCRGSSGQQPGPAITDMRILQLKPQMILTPSVASWLSGSSLIYPCNRLPQG